MLLRKHGWDPSTFVVAGETFTNRDAAPAALRVLSNPGYDGQFYFRIAMRPVSTAYEEVGVHFDYPVYRNQRILYPLLARIIGQGAVRPTLWALVFVNVVGITVLAYVIGCILASVGVQPLWALAVPLYVGFLVTISRDLCEVWEIALICASIYALQKQRVFLSVTLLTIAVFAKEPAILFCVGPLTVAFLHRLRAPDDRRRLLFVVPPLVYMSWKQWLFHAWKIPPSVSLEPLATPFSAYFAALRGAPHGSVLQTELLLLAIFVVIAVPALLTSRLTTDVRVSWAAFATLAFSLGSGFWMEEWAFLRAISEFASLGILLSVTGARWQQAAVLLLTVVTWLLLAVQLVAR